MSLSTWNPLSELEMMRQQMARLFNQVAAAGPRLPRWEMPRAFLPSVDVYTSGKELIVAVELPGFNPEDVTVEAAENVIHVSGESRREEEVQEDNYYRSERQFGQFDRVIPLPHRIRDQEAKASFRNGVLNIRAPLAEELRQPKARKVRVETK